MNQVRRFLAGVEAFFLKPASPRPIAALRIGLAIILIAQAYMLRLSVMDFFAGDGFVQGDLAAYFAVPDAPRIAWFVKTLAPYGFSETACIFGICWVYVASLILLLVGLGTRAASVVAFLLHWILMNSGYHTAYGVDLYAHVFLFT